MKVLKIIREGEIDGIILLDKIESVFISHGRISEKIYISIAIDNGHIERIYFDDHAGAKQYFNQLIDFIEKS
jgi:DNA-binding LacI/PurR family transcriptional regulator